MGRELRDRDAQVVSPPDRAVAALALRQHGVVSRAQLHVVGLTRNAVEVRIRNGRLHRVHRGVYAVGHPRLSLRGRFWAAVLATGGVLSHRSAAAAWDLLPAPSRVEVTTLRRSASVAAIVVHRSRTLAETDRTTTQADGLPVTTVTRTLVDLADVLSAHRVERVLHRAEQLRLLDARALTDRLAALPGRRAVALHRGLERLAVAEPDLSRSELEERFLALVATSDLPRPELNVHLHGYEVDALWRPQRLVVELDGAATHLTPTAFERDRRRDAELQVAGYAVVRVTWRQVTREPTAVAATLRALLGGRPPGLPA